MYSFASIKIPGLFFINTTNSLYTQEFPDKGLSEEAKFIIHFNDEYLGEFRLSPVQGCCGMVVVSGMWLDKKYRGGIYSDEIRSLKEKLCKALGYSVMLATTQMKNTPAVRNMEKSGYKFVHSFVNKRTKNLLSVGIKDI